MRKLGVVVLALGILLLGAAICSAKDIYVNPAHAPDATHATTINGGITLAANGDVIHVVPNPFPPYYYIEDVVINKNVRVVSTAGRLVTIIQPTAAANIAVEFFGVSNAAINGFTIRNATDGIGVSIGILGGTNVRVRNCIIQKCAIGIDVVSGFFAWADTVLIDGNTIRYSTDVNGGTNQGNGIVVEGYSADVTNVVITNNQLVDNDGYGIYVYGGSGTPSFSGMRIGSNTLVNNGATDFFVADNHNWNLAAIGFDNAHGAITLNNNKIQATIFAPPFNVVGGSTATFSGTGNATYNNCNKNVGGTATPLATP